MNTTTETTVKYFSFVLDCYSTKTFASREEANAHVAMLNAMPCRKGKRRATVVK